jgi:dynactin 1
MLSTVELPSEGPWIQRARDMKAIKQIDNDLEHKFQLAQNEIKDLILQLKLKEKALEEAHVKIKLLDSRMGNVKKQTDRISALEKQISEAKARETQFEEVIENLNGDLRNAESEIGKWRKAAKDGKIGVPGLQDRDVGAGMEEARLAEQVKTLQNALQYLRLENSRIQLHEAVAVDTWLHEPLFQSTPDSREGNIENKRRALVSDLRNFLSSCQFVDSKTVEIGSRGWKSNKSTAEYILRRQQEMYQRLCARRDDLVF